MAQMPPAIRDAISSGDIDGLQTVFRQAQREAEQRKMESQLIRPGEDPMDPEVQAGTLPCILVKHCRSAHADNSLPCHQETVDFTIIFIKALNPNELQLCSTAMSTDFLPS